VVAVKVLSAGGSGTWADVIAGVDFVTKDGVTGKSLASMSLGGGGSNAGLTAAITSCIQAGIPVIVAAGNSNADACSFTPSGIDGVISVGATEKVGVSPSPERDNRASYSNWGKCVDIFAPGTDITSAWIGSTNRETATISGTSMACPHVAGYAAALFSSETIISPEDLKKQLIASSQSGLISNVPAGTENRLLYNQCPI